MALESGIKPRKGLSLACEGCRKKKTRCSGEPGPCTGCVQSKIECHFSGYVKPRRTPVRAHRRINGLEERIATLERLLQEKEQRRSTSPQSIARVTQNDSLHAHDTLTSEACTRNITPLPPLEEAVSVATQYFSVANVMFPIFEESVIMPIVRMEYGNLAPNYGAIWTAINIILALAYQQQAAYPANKDSNYHDTAMNYLGNALHVINDLSIPRNPCSLSAQCLLGVAEVFRASSTPQKSSMYIAMAVRQIYHVGTHRTNAQPSVDPLQNLVSYRLYWIAYCIDRDISLRLDHPPMLSDTESNLVLGPRPGMRNDIDFVRDQNAALHTKQFRMTVELAVIQDATYRALNSARDEPRTCESLKQTEMEVATSLDQWFQELNIDFSPEALVSTYTPPYVVSLVVLFARYFNTLTTIHRLSYWSVQEMDAYKNSFACVNGTKCPSQGWCVKAARRLLRLFSILPRGNVPCQWLLIDYFVSAAVILLAGMIYNASFSQGQSDFELVKPIVAELESLKQYGDAERMEFIGKNCTELAKVAASILDARASTMDRRRNVEPAESAQFRIDQNTL